MTDSSLDASASAQNKLGLTRKDYEGAKSTLCKGCGHDAITASIISACYEAGVDPAGMVKLSGIGCSSKTTNYFINGAFGFNATHGRMAALAAGVKTANHTLSAIGVSGDGDTASIGLGNFAHMVRRNLDIVYIVENNGVYGLTKGQFSPTADEGSKNKKGWANPWPAVELAALAISMGATFVARSFSGDRKQLTALLQAAFRHRGAAIVDVLSPCVTFNDHEGSTRSLKAIRANRDPLNEVDFIPEYEDISVDYDEGTEKRIRLHDGSWMTLKKLKDHDPSNRMGALSLLEQATAEGKFLTGLIYINENRASFTEMENLTATPLSMLKPDQLRPPPSALEEINQRLMK